jgi:site-specific DNA-methyltransferase (adenine-specific)
MDLPGVQILEGDCLARLADIEDGTVQTCVTSPPYYGLRDYGVEGQIGLEASPDAYIARLVDIFREVRRVLASDGTLWINIGDSYGAGKQLLMVPARLALALQADGWVLRQDIIWHKPNPMPESVKDRCTKAHEYVFLLSKSEKYFYDADAVKENAVCDRMRGPALHADLKSTNGNGGLSRREPQPFRNRRSVWTVTTSSYKGAHFAVFPPALVEPCILAGSRPGDLVLDPFNGSGTTGQVALQNGRRYVGCELNAEYVKLTFERLHAVNDNNRQRDLV